MPGPNDFEIYRKVEKKVLKSSDKIPYDTTGDLFQPLRMSFGINNFQKTQKTTCTYLKDLLLSHTLDTDRLPAYVNFFNGIRDWDAYASEEETNVTATDAKPQIEFYSARKGKYLALQMQAAEMEKIASAIKYEVVSREVITAAELRNMIISVTEMLKSVLARDIAEIKATRRAFRNCINENSEHSLHEALRQIILATDTGKSKENRKEKIILDVLLEGVKLNQVQMQKYIESSSLIKYLINKSVALGGGIKMSISELVHELNSLDIDQLVYDSAVSECPCALYKNVDRFYYSLEVLFYALNNAADSAVISLYNILEMSAQNINMLKNSMVSMAQMHLEEAAAIGRRISMEIVAITKADLLDTGKKRKTAKKMTSYLDKLADSSNTTAISPKQAQPRNSMHILDRVSSQVLNRQLQIEKEKDKETKYLWFITLRSVYRDGAAKNKVSKISGTYLIIHYLETYKQLGNPAYTECFNGILDGIVESARKVERDRKISPYISATEIAKIFKQQRFIEHKSPLDDLERETDDLFDLVVFYLEQGLLETDRNKRCTESKKETVKSVRQLFLDMKQGLDEAKNTAGVNTPVQNPETQQNRTKFDGIVDSVSRLTMHRDRNKVFSYLLQLLDPNVPYKKRLVTRKHMRLNIFPHIPSEPGNITKIENIVTANNTQEEKASEINSGTANEEVLKLVALGRKLGVSQNAIESAIQKDMSIFDQILLDQSVEFNIQIHTAYQYMHSTTERLRLHMVEENEKTYRYSQGLSLEDYNDIFLWHTRAIYDLAEKLKTQQANLENTKRTCISQQRQALNRITDTLNLIKIISEDELKKVLFQGSPFTRMINYGIKNNLIQYFSNDTVYSFSRENPIGLLVENMLLEKVAVAESMQYAESEDEETSV